jgi:AraC-like DNA-binding protein
MVEALIREHVNQQPDKQDVIRHIINTIIAITARNITLMTPAPGKGRTIPSMDLLSYIHQNIYQPEQLKVERIAAEFNISPTYVSEYFKTRTGESLQQYITNYKMRLIETRLRYTDMQVNEIVLELGFTDASHLNRLFKKYKGVSPSAFRRSVGGEK